MLHEKLVRSLGCLDSTFERIDIEENVTILLLRIYNILQTCFFTLVNESQHSFRKAMVLVFIPVTIRRFRIAKEAIM